MMFLIVFAIGLIIAFLLGLCLQSVLASFIFMFLWICIGGPILLIIWAMFTVSAYFGIPLLIIIAIVILAWFIFGGNIIKIGN